MTAAVALTPEALAELLSGGRFGPVPVAVEMLPRRSGISPQRRSGVRVVSTREASRVLHLSTDFGSRHATASWNPHRSEYSVRGSSKGDDPWEMNGYVLTGTDPGWSPVLPVGRLRIREWRGMYGADRQFVSDDPLRRADDVMRAYEQNAAEQYFGSDDDPLMFEHGSNTARVAVSAFTEALDAHDAALTGYVLDVVASAVKQGAEPGPAVEHIRRMLGPCDCACAGAMPHTALQHENESCPGQTFDPPCGGCWNCMAMQAAYAEEQQRASSR